MYIYFSCVEEGRKEKGTWSVRGAENKRMGRIKFKGIKSQNGGCDRCRNATPRNPSDS